MLLRGQKPVSVGFWFAVGHSTIVLLLTAVLAGGYRWALQAATQGADITQQVSLAAGLMSVGLLGAIGALNAHIAWGLFRTWAGLQAKSADAQDAELTAAGDASLKTALSLVPCMRRVFEHVSKPHRMYGVGFLFGLSFDSATQVGLIGLAAMTGSSGRIPPAIVMIFPVAFSCGMCLIDTANGLLMLATYSWTEVRPMQKLFYNFVVTSMSAGIALVICSLELLQIVARQANLRGPFWTLVQDVDMVAIGYSIICSFLLVFLVAVCYSRGCFQCHSGVVVGDQVGA
uniref:Nickel/cobalt efflux system n=1 Tax=Zooxanthella nutricula TaxID=1333877 RepID=A0A7S2P7C5_9DINO